MDDTVHINLYLKSSWKKKLEQIAREQSVKEERNISLMTLIRESLSKMFDLK